MEEGTPETGRSCEVCDRIGRHTAHSRKTKRTYSEELSFSSQCFQFGSPGIDAVRSLGVSEMGSLTLTPHRLLPRLMGFRKTVWPNRMLSYAQVRVGRSRPAPGDGASCRVASRRLPNLMLASKRQKQDRPGKEHRQCINDDLKRLDMELGSGGLLPPPEPTDTTGIVGGREIEPAILPLRNINYLHTSY